MPTIFTRLTFDCADSRRAPALGKQKVLEAERLCFHCGTPCGALLTRHDKSFCCQGCLTVFELLTEHGLDEFYRLGESAGTRVNSSSTEDRFKFLDEPSVRERLADYSDERLTRVTFRIPSIHCIACVWLLENLFRLKSGLGRSQVDFPHKEVSIIFQTAEVKLSEVAALLASLGYEPELNFSDLDAHPAPRTPRRLWLQLGVAGFAFGNTMLFSIASYLGLDTLSGPGFRKLVGFLSLVLAIPVVAYSALDYWRSAWISLRQRLLNIEVPIAAGIAALFLQSAYEVLSGRGDGYFDSLAGLLFFLLCGKLFQQKTYDRLAFDRDYKSFFPLSVTRKVRRSKATSSSQQPARFTGREHVRNGHEERVSLSQLAVGDRLLLRNGELIPADARLVAGPALIDYSFVTGESELIAKRAGETLYAGGRQIGSVIEVETTKPVSQSYLTSLWNQEAFRKEKTASLKTLTDEYSQRFTKLVIGVAVGAALVWALLDPSIWLKAFTSVLIVACPCALALAAPFALGTAQRVLARREVFLKNPSVIESLDRIDTVVFDKTGTLTAPGQSAVLFSGPPLRPDEQLWLHSLTRHSTHPHSARIGEYLAARQSPLPTRSFRERIGSGMEGHVTGHEIWLGSAAWLESRGIEVGQASSLSNDSHIHGLDSMMGGQNACPTLGSAVHVAIDGKYRGGFLLTNALRPETAQIVGDLAGDFELALLSGDNDKERARFRQLFGPSAHLHFNQSPLHKLNFIQNLQNEGKTVLMVGDGLNDSGALKQSDVGVAVVENLTAFSPASDVIMPAEKVAQLQSILRFAKSAVRVVRASFLISAIYNVVGVAIAARGLLSPIVCAILMPLSSITVVAFACGVTSWLGRRMLAPVRKDYPRSEESLSLNLSTPAPLPRGELAISARKADPLLGGEGVGSSIRISTLNRRLSGRANKQSHLASAAPKASSPNSGRNQVEAQQPTRLEICAAREGAAL
ncbi:MAG: heavy metal translocating P-type ATPase metal-binding domain-containing protein [Verrucomicrobia bacterium]|nr:heavy metal translocating P-type ATPase metal-binding domain-containing protein [Verrucomicrobiota bacterium]